MSETLCKEKVLLLKKIPVVKCEGVVYLEIIIPIITYPNYSRKNKDKKKLVESAVLISLLLEFVNCVHEKDVGTDIYLSNNLQLMVISTRYYPDKVWRRYSLKVGFDSIA